MENIDYLVKDDYLIDSGFAIDDKEFFFYGRIQDIKNFKGNLTYGRMPEQDDELVLLSSNRNYDLTTRSEEILNKNYTLKDNSAVIGESDVKVKVVGIIISNENVANKEIIYGTENFTKAASIIKNINTTSTETIINNQILKAETYSNSYKVIGNKNVPKGTIYVSENLRMICKNYRCLNSKVKIKFNHLYFTEEYEGKITKEFNKKNFKQLLNLTNYDEYSSTIFINEEDLKEVFNKEYFQTSVYVENPYKIDPTDQELKDLGYETLQVKTTLGIPYFEEFKAFAEIIQVVFIAILTVGLFFISYFIVKLILKSRNIYFSTIRILGSSRKVAKNLLDIELFTVFNLAFLVFLTLVYLVRNNIVIFKPIKDLTEFFLLRDYIVLYLILIFMSYLIANRFAKKLFKKSAMKTYREEV